jgi:hypothetical protein
MQTLKGKGSLEIENNGRAGWTDNCQDRHMKEGTTGGNSMDRIEYESSVLDDIIAKRAWAS